MIAPAAPFDIRIETDNFLLRTLTAEDASRQVCNWFADANKARMINAPPQALTLERLRRYVASHDRISGHLLGIFARGNGEPLGFWSVYVDWENGEFLVNVLVGERGRKCIGAREETQMALLDFFFETLNLEVFRCTVLAANRYVGSKLLRASGATLEHSDWRPSTTAQAFVEIHYYRGDKSAWHRLREKLRARRSG